MVSVPRTQTKNGRVRSYHGGLPHICNNVSGKQKLTYIGEARPTAKYVEGNTEGIRSTTKPVETERQLIQHIVLYEKYSPSHSGNR